MRCALPNFFSALGSGQLALVWRFLIGHTKFSFHTARNRTESVYVCYAGIVTAAWLGLPFKRKHYPITDLDAFISLYDTVVMDLRMLKEDGILAKSLYRQKRRRFEAATSVIVDAPENVAY